MENILGHYFGVDWFAMIMTLLFLYLIGNKKRYGFIFYLLGNIAWMYVNATAKIWPGVILNITLIILNFRAYIKWKE